MVIPRKVQGKYRDIKRRIGIVLLAIIIVVPFVRIAGKPVILLDIPARKFHILGLTIWPQELYFLHVLLLMGGVMLFFFTALLGRIWCGYACPQTIFTELYDRVARLFGGSKYDKQSMNKWGWVRVYAAWSVLSLLLSVVYISYFMPWREVLAGLLTMNVFVHPDSWQPAAWFVSFMGLTIFSFGNAAYFRENVCKYVCPYGRFQTALLDNHSPIVAYNKKRGEPRREKGQKVQDAGGDCIDCHLCVLVCPTGIDIRDGLQVGCLHCGLCDDACTQVMAKFKKETLIDYRTVEQVDNPRAPQRYFRPRTAIYGTILAMLAIAFTYLVWNRVPLYADVLRDRAVYNIHIPGVGYQNGYELHVANLSEKKMRFTFDAKGGGFEIIRPRVNHEIGPGGFEKIRFIVRYRAAEKPPGNLPLRINVRDADQPEHSRRLESVFSFPR